MSLPEDYGITYGYDALGRMTSLTSPLASNPAQWTYYDNGAVHRRTAPCGAYTDYAYDVKGNLTSLVSKNASNSTLSSYGSFTYDAVFNLTSYAASVTGQTSHSGTTEYTYDSLDRLTFEGSEKLGGYEYEFAYDDASNPTTFRNVGSLTYNSSNQKSGTGYAYDGNGNPTTYAGTSLGFDLESRLTAIDSSWSAGYRSDGLRGSKTVSSTTFFLYDGATPVAELNSSGTITALNVFGADGLIGRVVPGGTDIQYLFDHQGNVAQRLDGSGSVVSKSTYDAYGAESSTSTPTDPFGYNAQSGYTLDRETGLYLCTYRYYDPAKGRWINRDPIGYAGGMNLYGYCGAGPVGGVDTLGFRPWPADAALGVLEGLWNSGVIAQGLSAYNFAVGAVAAYHEDNGLTPLENVRGFSYNAVIGSTWDNATFQNGVQSGVAFWTPIAISLGAGVPEGECTVPADPSISHFSPNTGVPIGMDGFPIFEAEADVIIKPTGSHAGDVRAANKTAGVKPRSDQQWHHHQDYGRMQLVNATKHTDTKHIGGWSIWGNFFEKGR